MTNVSAYPVTIDGRRLDDLAIGVEASSVTLGGLRSGDQPLAGLDGEVGSVNDSREPSAFTLGMLVRGTDADGFVPAGADGQATYQRNLQTLKHLVAKTGALLDVRRVVDKASSALLGTGGVVNVARNPTLRQSAAVGEYRRNYCTNPNLESGLITGWANYSGVTPASISAVAGAAYSGSYGLSATADGTSSIPRVYMNFPAPFVTGGDWLTVTCRFRLAAGTGWAANASPYFLMRGSKPSAGGEWVVGGGPAVLSGPDANGWMVASITGQVDPDNNGAMTLNIGVGNGIVAPNTATFHVDEVLVEKAAVSLPYFDGSTAATAEGFTHDWGGGTPHLSLSRQLLPSLSATGPFMAYSSTAYLASGRVIVGTEPRIRILSRRTESGGSIVVFTNTGPTDGYTAAAAGETAGLKMQVRQASGTAVVRLIPKVGFYSAAGAGLLIGAADGFNVPTDGSWVDINSYVTQAPANTASARWLVYLTGSLPAGTVLEFRRPLMVKGLAVGDGSNIPATYDPEGARVGWVGVPEGPEGQMQGSADVRASCKVVDAITPEDSPGDYGRLTVALKVLGTYWRGLNWLTWHRDAVVSGTAYEITSLETSSAPVDDAVVCLTGPANAGVQIVDDATGNAVRLNEALPAGSVWRVNSGTWESRVGVGLTVASTDADGTDRAAVTDQVGTYPRYLRLNPRDDGTGRRVVRIKAVGTGFTAATALDVKARRSHL